MPTYTVKFTLRTKPELLKKFHMSLNITPVPLIVNWKC